MVYFTYLETSKITLAEVSIIFDGKKAVKNDLLQKQEIDVSEEHEQGKGEKSVMRSTVNWQNRFCLSQLHNDENRPALLVKGADLSTPAQRILYSTYLALTSF